MIQGLLAKAGFRIALGIAAVCGVIFTPIAIVQTVRIDGFWGFGSGLNGKIDGLYASINNPVDGFIVKLDRAGGQLLTCRSQVTRQNKDIDDWKRAADKNAAFAASLLVMAKGQAGELRARAKGILASPTVGDACVAAFNRNRENAK